MVHLNLTEWEIERIVAVMESGPQQTDDRELMIKLWEAQKRARRMSNQRDR